MAKFQTQYKAERSPFDKQELGSDILVAAGIDYLEGSAKSGSIGEVQLQPINKSDSSTGLFSQRLGKWSDDSGESRTSPTPEDWRGCYKRRKTTETWAIVSHTTDDDHAWKKYGEKEILNAKYPRSYFKCTRRLDKGCLATKQVQRMEEDPQMFQITYKGLHTCKDTLKGPQIIREPDPWETYIVNNPPDSMWGNSKQADHDQALSSSTTPTMKQESKEEALSDLTDNLSSLGTKQADHD
ncbi:hypothetical protein RGQ29_029409 [Quercus rubra]|uniref:WRKY domain-containing protein n=1 Tax=Quercus rubra TaxID=3512 RepID=A0AAN7EUW5_QUERU|nr:hypothetical protein RGQ29_029409 [Quercus rubra]